MGGKTRLSSRALAWPTHRALGTSLPVLTYTGPSCASLSSSVSAASPLSLRGTRERDLQLAFVTES